MKGLLAGCLIVAVVAGAAFGVASYYAFRYAKPMIESASDYAGRARDLSSIGAGIHDQSEFAPPGTGELTASQVDRFLAVQTRVRSEVGDRWGDVEAQAAEIKRKTDADKRDLSLIELQAAFSSVATIYLEARKAQVGALNVQKFSAAEYAWVRRRIYEAAGFQLAHGIDMTALEDLARNGARKTGVTMPTVTLPDIPPRNVELVKQHTSKLKDWLPMAILGL